MATQKLRLELQGAIFDNTNPPQFVENQGTNLPVFGIAFDGGSTDEICYFIFSAENYGSGNLTARIKWYADSAVGGNVRFGAALAAITPNTDTQDVETKSFAAVQEVNDTHLGTTAQRLHEVSLTISNLDSIADGDLAVIKFYREASDTVNDTLTGDVIVVDIILEYSDT